MGTHVYHLLNTMPDYEGYDVTNGPMKAVIDYCNRHEPRSISKELLVKT